MAIRLASSSSQGLTFSGGVSTYNSAYTVLMSVYLTTDRNERTLFCTLGGVGGAGNIDALETTSSGTTLRISVNESAGANSTSELAVGGWTNIAMVRSSATSLTLFVNGVQVAGPVTTNVTSRAAMDLLRFGSWFALFNFLNGRISNAKLFARALTGAEILQEHSAVRPISTDSLWGWWPCVDSTLTHALKDFSGNGRNLTGVNTPTVEDGPPVGWGAPALVCNRSVAVRARLAMMGVGR
jgi:phosphotransferase system IIB component